MSESEGKASFYNDDEDYPDPNDEIYDDNDDYEIEDEDEDYDDGYYDPDEEPREPPNSEYVDPHEKIRKVIIHSDLIKDEVTVYPLKKGKTFREIRGNLCKGGRLLIIESQSDIDELRRILNEIEKINQPLVNGEKKPKQFNRFSEIEVVTKHD
jgi:hypothetical protein